MPGMVTVCLKRRVDKAAAGWVLGAFAMDVEAHL